MSALLNQCALFVRREQWRQPRVLSNISIEEVSKCADGDLWFQLYVVQRDLASSLVRRARAANCSTLILTVGVAVNGLRERDLRNGFAIPFKPGVRTLIDGTLAHERQSVVAKPYWFETLKET
ncbi:alpha-hydroxy-acid oxidizing protein [Caballeronia sordidicola]|uniref:alpha-hydroxy-acid oxidizing protein n=1 Tax=Caballeronia sordidicola TaxID=196367 RepID=UPI00277D1268|nr:alpha-hydroxy-acid oxidizing protein [Caballeronia sordidicola]